MKSKKTQLKENATFRDLLKAIDRLLAADPSIDGEKRKERMELFTQTTDHLAVCLHTTISDLRIKDVVATERKFCSYVQRLPRKGGCKAEHLARRKQMIRFARLEGWTCDSFALEDEWADPRKAVKGKYPGKSMIDDAIKAELHTWELSDAWLAGWGARQIGKKYRYSWAAKAQTVFRQALRLAKLEHRFPSLGFPDPIHYRLPPRELPAQIRREIAAILWRMRKEGRLHRVRLTWSIARGVVLRFQEFCGYAVRVLDMTNLVTLEQILTKRLVRKYVRWLHDREWGVRSISAHVNRIKNILRYHPVLGDEDFSWIKGLVEEISDTEDDEFVAGGDDSVVLFSDLETSPDKIRQKRQKRLKQKGCDDRLVAFLVMQELLMLWIITHPWPPTCIRNCRIKGIRKNLFFERLPKGGPPFALTPAVEKAWRQSRHRQRFWQFLFSPAETPDHRLARGLVVQRLLRLLKIYLSKYRKVLVNPSKDPGTLFVNLAGQKFDSGKFAKLIGEICQEHLGAWLTLSEIRRIYGFAWLARNKKDPLRYEKLSVILWIGLEAVQKQFASGPIVRYPRRNSPRRGFLSRVDASSA